MTRRTLAACLLALCLACASAPPERGRPSIEERYGGGAVVLTLRVFNNPSSIVEPLIVELEADGPETHEVELPPRVGSPDDFPTVSGETSSPRLLDGGRVAVTRTYELEALEPGEYVLAPISVRFWDKSTPDRTEQIQSGEIRVRVESVLPEDEENPELTDISGPVDMPLPAWLWAAIGCLLVAAAAALWYWSRRRGGGELAVVEAPAPAPDEVALSELQALLDRGLLEAGEHKRFFELLSNILRRYIESRFGLRAPERTTEEFLNELRHSAEIQVEHRVLLSSFLQHCDLVKFAELRPSRNDADEAVAACRRFIAETSLPKAAPERPTD